MALFLTCGGLLLFSLVAHLLVWRIALPRRHTVALLTIFTICPVVGLLLQAWLWPTASVSGPWEWVLLGLAYVPASLTYICLYSLIEFQSPTVMIVEHIRAAGGRVAVPELRGLMADEQPLRARLGTLATSGILLQTGDHYAVAPRFGWFARLLVILAIVLGVTEGG
jgi:hypothetical protein